MENKPLITGKRPVITDQSDASETQPILSVLSKKTDQNDVVSNYFSRKTKKMGILTFFNYAKESLLPERMKKSF